MMSLNSSLIVAPPRRLGRISSSGIPETASPGTAPVHQRGLHFLHNRAIVLDELALDLDHSAVGFARLLFFDDRDFHVQRVAVLDRSEHAPFVDAEQGEQRAVVDTTSVLQTAHDRVNKGTVSDGLAERCALAVLPVGMHFVEIAGETREVDDIRRRYRACRRRDRLPHLEIFPVKSAYFWWHVLMLHKL